MRGDNNAVNVYNNTVGFKKKCFIKISKLIYVFLFFQNISLIGKENCLKNKFQIDVPIRKIFRLITAVLTDKQWDLFSVHYSSKKHKIFISIFFSFRNPFHYDVESVRFKICVDTQKPLFVKQEIYSTVRCREGFCHTKRGGTHKNATYLQYEINT